MVDTRATHNYLTSTEVERLGLVLKKDSGKVKTINLVAQLITGVAKSMLIKIEKATSPIPKLVRRFLQKCEDVMLKELPRRLPPMRAIDHEIELIPGVKPLARASYRMAQHELEELRK
ncbi:Uncharacterized protein Adt_06395 [Abeliophyllum distichum]|uniref:Uncharacterized protein n=1 Tax=Abeliophyllum distichum TaxID=126358 RepID=A0ABD1V6Y7_9LAMI